MPHRAPLHITQDTATVELERLTRRLRLAAVLLSIPMLLVPFLVDGSGFWSVLSGIVGAIGLVIFAGPTAWSAGKKLTHRIDGSWTLDDEVVAAAVTEDDARDVAYLFVLDDHERTSPPGPPPTRSPDRPSPHARVKLLRLRGAPAAAVQKALAERDLATMDATRRVDPALGLEAAELGMVVDAAECICDFAGNAPSAYHAAIGYGLARHAIAGFVIDERKQGGSIRLVSSAMTAMPRIERLGRTEPWTTGEDVTPELATRPGDPGMLIGTICVAGWWFALYGMSSIALLATGGFAIAALGTLAWLARPTLRLDADGLRQRGWLLWSRSRAMSTIADVVAVDESVFVANLDPREHVEVFTSDAKSARRLAASMRATIAHHASEQLTEARARRAPSERGPGDEVTSMLPAPHDPSRLPHAALLHEDRVGSVAILGGRLRLVTSDDALVEIELSRPFRALLSRSEDLAGVTLLHLELRQAPPGGAGDWTRMLLSCRVESPMTGLARVPEQGQRGTFVPLEAMMEVVAIVRGAMLTHDVREHWV